MGFAIASTAGRSGGGDSPVPWFAYFMVLCKVTLSTAATLYGEVSFGKSTRSNTERVPFMVQCNQIWYVFSFCKISKKTFCIFSYVAQISICKFIDFRFVYLFLKTAW